ncbi:MAG: archaemetzincin [candidate division KSB1 bacterium]|nr:archaemetzincin [candidate division KSB1 bacterium]MDZ7377387.1 archaemetzincin [candidate division KSB1 bacterium]MDZ7399702.1 archaemetzincin [candidate division KSB1 bacterium]
MIFILMLIGIMVWHPMAEQLRGQSAMNSLDEKIEKLRPLHRPKRPPEPGDWLAVHKEPEQTFEQYIASHPLRPSAKLNTIYVQPIGNLTPGQQNVVNLAVEYIGSYFNLPVQLLPPLPLEKIPTRARRRHPEWGMEQLLTTYILDEVLVPHRPKNALALLGLTAVDLWPGMGWNFVFGQASLSDRVGVWSIYRNGDPDASEQEFTICLERTIKTAVHEIGHILGMMHCIAYECVMNGSNHREESDRRPLYLCPECLKKLCWNLQVDPLARYEKLVVFCQQHHLNNYAKFFHDSIQRLRDQ